MELRPLLQGSFSGHPHSPPNALPQGPTKRPLVFHGTLGLSEHLTNTF